MKKNKTEYRVGIGASSVLLILVVLAMTALALLSFGNARNTEALTSRNTEMTVLYYEAAAQAQQHLALIDQAVLEWREAKTDVMSEAWFQAYDLDALWFETDEGLRFLLQIPAGNNRMLEVGGTVFASGNARYRVDTHMLKDASEQEEAFMTLMGN